MVPAVTGEALLGHTVVSRGIWAWALLAAAAIVAQRIAGFWWNRGVSVIGAGTSAMFMNIPPFIALLTGHFVLHDAIYVTQVLGGVLVLLGVLIANKSTLCAPKTETGIVQPSFQGVQVTFEE